MFSMCSELTPRAPIPDTRIPQLMQPWPAAGWSKMLKTSEERERTDDFFAPSPHPESYPSQPSLSMWGGNTWQPHRGTHCHTGGSHWVQSQRYPHCGGAEDQQGHHRKANIYQEHHSHTRIYQPATQSNWPSCRASGTTQSKGTPQERPKK